MGDQAAADIATESHGNIIKASGGLRRSERLIYRDPTPLSFHGYYEGIVVDDRMGMQRTRLHGNDVPQVLRERFRSAQPWYAAAGLAVKLSKSVREESTFTGWGQQTEGLAGLSGPVRSRLWKLMQVTAEFTNLKGVTFDLLETLRGFWGHCFLSRRCLYCLFSHVYKVEMPQPIDKPIKLNCWTRNELALAAALGPQCVADLRASARLSCFA
jgi:hypothetical protein